MRYPASEKLEIIRTVEGSHLPIRQTLKMLGIPSSTYYDWYAPWSDGGLDALADQSPRPASVWIRKALVLSSAHHILRPQYVVFTQNRADSGPSLQWNFFWRIVQKKTFDVGG